MYLRNCSEPFKSTEHTEYTEPKPMLYLRGLPMPEADGNGQGAAAPHRRQFEGRQASLRDGADAWRVAFDLLRDATG